MKLFSIAPGYIPIGGGKRGHIVADTLLLVMFSWASKRGNICCGHKMFLTEIRNIFVSRTQILCPQQMLPARANWETFVSATMCPQHCVLVCHHLMEGRKSKDSSVPKAQIRINNTLPEIVIQFLLSILQRGNQKLKNPRPVNKRVSEEIFHTFRVSVPIGSGKYIALG